MILSKEILAWACGALIASNLVLAIGFVVIESQETIEDATLECRVK